MLQDISIEEEALALKKLITDFLNERLQKKLSESKSKADISLITNAYQFEIWLTDAAKRVHQIQIVTHANKFMNSAIKGTNIYLPLKPFLRINKWVSTQTLQERKEDAVGNPSVLVLYKFLQLTLNNQTLLSRIMNNDIALKNVIPGTDSQKEEWLNAFKSITHTKTRVATHSLAKQIYFPVEDSYHILAPLFPTSLANMVFEKIKMQFSSATKMARKARKQKLPHSQGYKEYFNLVIQKFGGSKPQNISELNSSRGGKCYLLPSLPPTWKNNTLKPPFNTKTILNIFKPQVRSLIEKHHAYLTNIHTNDCSILQTREELVARVCDQFLFFAAKIQSLPGGWSLDSACQLPTHQKLWLDPDRVEIEPEWQHQRQITDWQSEVTHEFTNWLNNILNQALKTKYIIVDDSEYLEWKTLIKKELKIMTRGIV
jgi:CRISPR-associated protein Csy1